MAGRQRRLGAGDTSSEFVIVLYTCRCAIVTHVTQTTRVIATGELIGMDKSTTDKQFFIVITFSSRRYFPIFSKNLIFTVLHHLFVETFIFAELI